MSALPPPNPARAAAIAIVRRLRDAGHVAYLAGGCVRDTLLGLAPKDYDVATDAPPDAVLRMFKRSRAVGEAFGVVLVRSGHGPDAADTEVATFRAEWGYSDGRRPDGVAFTDAPHDAQRRDFTVNALFADPDPGTHATHPERPPPGGDACLCVTRRIPGLGVVVDYVGGLADLEARVIRAVGDADARFAEDYLRMLRAVRFAARLGFALEPKTAAAIRAVARYLGQISRERIGAETLAMLAHPTRADAAATLQHLRLDGPTLNEDPAEPALPTLAALPAAAPPAVTLAAWMLDRHTPRRGLAPAAAFIAHRGRRVVSRWRGALCLSNDDRDALARVLRLLVRAGEWDQLPTAARKRLLADPGWDEAATLLAAVEAGAAEAIAHDAQPLRDDGIGLAPTPWLGGEDLIALGLEPGPVFKRLLDGVYDAQLDGRVTDRDAAIAWVQSHSP